MSEEKKLAQSVFDVKDQEIKQGEELQRGLKARHMFMISIGGVIGTGLFVSSGYSIAQAGPFGAVIIYSVTGLLMFITMRCLGEMSVFMPIAGSFQVYTTKFISPGAGFASGWFYWLNYAISIPFELVISGEMMQKWVPESTMPVWGWATIFALIFIVLNVFAVKFFGEAEFWFCSIKVFAIILFIILGICQIIGIMHIQPTASVGFGNFNVDGKLFPTSFAMMMTAFITVAFSFNGTEIIGLTAGESSDPEKQLKKSINNTAVRTLLFYVGSILVLVLTIPWKDFVGVEFKESPFVMSLQNLGFSWASDVMNFVVITAALSCGNSLLYSCMRLLYGMGNEHQAPKFVSKVTKNGVPRNALIFTMIIVCLYQLTAVYQPATIALLLTAISSLAGMINWALICLAEFRFRRQYKADGGKEEDLKFKMFGYPFFPIFGFVANLAMISAFVFLPGNLSQLFIMLPLFIALWIGYDIYYKKKVIAGHKEALDGVNKKEDK